jgi:simple sugar transport system permease protein
MPSQYLLNDMQKVQVRSLQSVRKYLPTIVRRTIMGIIPLVAGLIATVGIVYLILYFEGNVLTTTVQDITLNSEESAQLAANRLDAGQSVSDIAESDDFADNVEDFSADALLKGENEARRKLRGSSEIDTYVEQIFSKQATGTIIGPVELRNEWYVARIESQKILGLRDIYARIDERILSDFTNRVNVVNFWLPIFLCSCGLVLTFSAGLWNIGIEGQIGMGAIGATGIALWMADDFSRNQLLIAAMLMGAAAGGGWALFTAIMRTRGGVHEIFGGVALNFIASGFTAYLVTGPWKPGSTATATENFDEVAWLPKLNDQTNLSPTTLYIALFGFLFVLIAMSITRWGLQLRAMGRNERSANVLGVPTERNIWLAMTICGMFAGISGAHIVLFTKHNLPVGASGGIGFLSLLVVLLASIQILYVPFISITFALLNFSPTPLQIAFGDKLHRSLVGVFVGLLVFFVFIGNGARRRFEELIEQRRLTAEKAAAGPPQIPQPPTPEVENGL